MRVRLEIDAARCDGHAICALVCPELISLDEWGYANVDPSPAETPAIVARARAAVRACPAGALTVVEDRDPRPAGVSHHN